MNCNGDCDALKRHIGHHKKEIGLASLKNHLGLVPF